MSGLVLLDRFSVSGLVLLEIGSVCVRSKINNTKVRLETGNFLMACASFSPMPSALPHFYVVYTAQ